MRRLEGILAQPSLRPTPRPAPPKRDVEFKPYQLKTKKKQERKELPDPTPNGKEKEKKLRRMKKKLNELNRKIRHSKKKNDGLIHKRNALRKAIESAKHGTESQRSVPEPKFIFKECEQAFRGAYRSYRDEGTPKMDPETFFRKIREGLIEKIKQELGSRNSARVQTTTWIRFTKDNERIELAFNSRMMNLHRGSDLDQIVDEMFAHMMTQIENPALLNSRFVFDEVLFLDTNFNQLNLTRGSSCLPLSPWLAKKKVIINPNNDDTECFKWEVIAADRI